MRTLACVSDRAAAVQRAVPHFLRAVDPDALTAHVVRLCAHDRYQASEGIVQAAELVADAAVANGLHNVRIERFLADGVARWWSFQAPIAWTPLHARLVVRGPGGEAVVVDHARQPFAIATHSAPTPAGGVTAPLVHVSSVAAAGTATRAIAVVPEGAFARGDMLPALAASGAHGFITDAAARPFGERSNRGRIELDPRTPLFGFSLTASELRQVQRWSDEGTTAHAKVAIDRGAVMPVVTAVLPGAGALAREEVWLIAHLCHPRPSANDNASGVAALLGIAAVHAAARRSDAVWATARTIRFVWGPEMVGTAALLHSAHCSPAAVINLDMVGEDQRRCGGPLIVERNPDCQPGLVAPAAETVMDEVFARTRAHVEGATWAAAPFAGFSDHALFAGPHVGAPAVQICHAPDRFNHSAADAPDKVSPSELARATAAGATLALLLASDPVVARPALTRALDAWSARGQAAAHRAIEDDAAWIRQRVDYMRRRDILLRAQLDGAEPQSPRATPQSQPGEPPIAAGWEGPFNARALLVDLTRGGGEGAALAARIDADRDLHALLTNVAIRCDGTRNVEEITAEISFALGHRVAPETVGEMTHALVAAGWATAEPETAAPEAG